MRESLYDIFKPLVFDYLDVISKGTNKKAVKQLLTPEGISYTFELPYKLSKTFYKHWLQKTKTK